MPSGWSPNALMNGEIRATAVPHRRCRSADTVKKTKDYRHDHDVHDSSSAELSTVQTQMDWTSARHTDTPSPGDDVDDCQSLEEALNGAKMERAYPDVKISQYKAEIGRLKELLRSRTHDLRDKCCALSNCQAELAEALISQTTDDCVKGRQIHKLARDLKDRLCYSEMEMKLLRKERDQAVLDLRALSGKMATCTTIAEEQAKLLKGQLDTIRKFEKKIQILEKTLQDMRADHKQRIQEGESSMHKMQVEHHKSSQDFERRMKEMHAEHKKVTLEIQMLETSMEDMEAGHKQEVEVLEKSMQDLRAGYKEERVALEEQLRLHQQRSELQDRKIRKYHHELNRSRSELLKGKRREAEMEDQLQVQTTICQDTTKGLHAATKEIEQLNSVTMELHEQEERMEQLWVDNARLVQLLAESGDYEKLLHEMQGGKGLVFCPVKASRFQILAQRYGSERGCGAVNPKIERDNWIPVELYDLIMAFRKEYCPALDIEIVHEVLRIISTFWREKQKRILYQVKMKNEKHMSDLKRKLLHRLPYEQVVQPSQSRPTKRASQSKEPKHASLATRGEHPFQSEPYRLTREIAEFCGSRSTRRGVANDHQQTFEGREAADKDDYPTRGAVCMKHQIGFSAGEESRRTRRNNQSNHPAVRESLDDHHTPFATRGENGGDNFGNHYDHI